MRWGLQSLALVSRRHMSGAAKKLCVYSNRNVTPNQYRRSSPMIYTGVGSSSPFLSCA